MKHASLFSGLFRPRANTIHTNLNSPSKIHIAGAFLAPAILRFLHAVKKNSKKNYKKFF